MVKEKSKTQVFFKIVYGVHVSLTVLVLIGTIYLAVEMRKTQAELNDFKGTCVTKNIKDSALPSDKVKKTASKDEKPKNHDIPTVFVKINKTVFGHSGLKQRILRSAFEVNDSCAERIKNVVDLLLASNKQDNTTYASVICLPGPKGDKGSQGRDGVEGREGPPGPPGKYGNISLKGDKGEQGATGQSGTVGPPGPKGDAGAVTKLFEVPPKITVNPPKVIMAKEENNLSLVCEARGNPPPTITWRKGNTSYPSTMDFAGSTRTSTLVFKQLTYDNSGMYHCEAKNTIGETSVAVEIIFPVPPKRIPVTNKVAYKGNSTILHCPVSSYPPSHIKWMKPGRKIRNGSGYRIDKKLTILNVQQQHEGVYLCVAQNPYGSIFTAVALEVRDIVKPMFLDQPPISKGMFISQVVQIKCRATGDPLPTVYWTKDGTNVTFPMMTKDRQTNSELIIEKFDEEHEGNYSCIADNNIGHSIAATTKIYLVQCPTLPTPINGYKTSLSKNSKDVMLFSCAEKQMLVGSNIRVCQANASWTGIQAHCLGSSLENGSMILLNENNYKQILINWLKSVASHSSVKWELCYRASRDGWSAFAFHGSCGVHKSTVTIIKVGQYIFGGFSDKAFGVPTYENINRYGYNRHSRTYYCKSSSKSFIFSLRNNDNLPPFQSRLYQNTAYAICTDPSEGPSFSSDIIIKDFAGKSNRSTSSFGHTYKPPPGYIYDEQKTNILLAGSESFQLDELEIFYELQSEIN